MPQYKDRITKAEYYDAELKYVNKGYIIEFFHIPTGKVVQFKALLTDFSDNYESEWNSENVYGRMDPIETYKSTRRKINLSWEVVSEDLESAKINLRKSSLLFSMLYPVYNDYSGNSTSISCSPIFRLKFSNLIQEVGKNTSTTGVSGGPASINGLIGRVDGFIYRPDLESGMFESLDNRLYPQTIRLECVYTVQHMHKLGWDRNGNPREGKFPYDEDFPESSKSLEDVNEDSQEKGTEEQEKYKIKKILEFT